jgi:hypothetical protein
MGFRYLDRIVSEDNIRSLLDLADLAAGGGLSADNVFQLSHRLRQSNPMQVCQRLLARDPKSTALIQQRRLSVRALQGIWHQSVAQSSNGRPVTEASAGLGCAACDPRSCDQRRCQK